MANRTWAWLWFPCLRWLAASGTSVRGAKGRAVPALSLLNPTSESVSGSLIDLSSHTDFVGLLNNFAVNAAASV